MSTPKEMAAALSKKESTSTEKEFMLVIRDVNAFLPAGKLLPFGGRFRRVEGQHFIIDGGNAGDTIILHIGTDCVKVRRTRKETVTETFEVI